MIGPRKADSQSDYLSTLSFYRTGPYRAQYGLHAILVGDWLGLSKTHTLLMRPLKRWLGPDPQQGLDPNQLAQALQSWTTEDRARQHPVDSRPIKQMPITMP